MERNMFPWPSEKFYRVEISVPKILIPVHALTQKGAVHEALKRWEEQAAEMRKEIHVSGWPN